MPSPDDRTVRLRHSHAINHQEEARLKGFDEKHRLTHWINVLSVLDDCIMEILESSDAE